MQLLLESCRAVSTDVRCAIEVCRYAAQQHSNNAFDVGPKSPHNAIPGQRTLGRAIKIRHRVNNDRLGLGSVRPIDVVDCRTTAELIAATPRVCVCRQCSTKRVMVRCTTQTKNIGSESAGPKRSVISEICASCHFQGLGVIL